MSNEMTDGSRRSIVIADREERRLFLIPVDELEPFALSEERAQELLSADDDVVGFNWVHHDPGRRLGTAEPTFQNTIGGFEWEGPLPTRKNDRYYAVGEISEQIGW